MGRIEQGTRLRRFHFAKNHSFEDIGMLSYKNHEFRKIWPLTWPNEVKYWPRTPKNMLKREISSRPIYSFFFRDALSILVWKWLGGGVASTPLTVRVMKKGLAGRGLTFGDDAIIYLCSKSVTFFLLPRLNRIIPLFVLYQYLTYFNICIYIDIFYEAWLRRS